jgi:hypothetical protein
LEEELERVDEFHSSAVECCTDLRYAVRNRSRSELLKVLERWDALRPLMRPPLKVSPELFAASGLKLVH